MRRHGAWARLLVTFPLLLSACTSLPPEETQAPLLARETPHSFVLEGRLAVKHGTEQFSARIDWRHDDVNGKPQDEILISSPLGQGLAQLKSDAQGAQLEVSGQQAVAAPDMETLSEKMFGVRLPLTNVASWVLGRAVSSMAQIERDERARLLRLNEDGWQVDYLDYENAAPNALPTLLFIQRGEIEVRLKVDSWTPLP